MTDAVAHRAKRRVIRTCIAVACAVLALGLLLRWAVQASLPDESNSVSLQGRDGLIGIAFDARARPTVRAASLEDVLYAQGWLHARERAWQMELVRRAGQGRLAELLGADLIETDRELWRAGVPQLAARLAAHPSPQSQRGIAAYVAGVNAGLASLRVRPPEFLLLMHRPRPWTPADVYAVGAIVAWDSSNNLDNELVRFELRRTLDPRRFSAFLPGTASDPTYPYVIPQGTPAVSLADALDAETRDGLPSVAFGSNGWAVAASRSRTGNPLFAFDSHDLLALPNLFYEIHLYFGAGRQLRGWSVAGLPGVINGFNEYWAWGLTNIGDTQDLFLLQEETPVLRSETVEIPVRGRSQPESLRIDYTAYGPVISDAPRLALSWTGHRVEAGGIDALFALNLATDLDAIEAAFDRHEIPVANVTWATRDGHIGFRTIGTLPRRGAGDGTYPLAAEPGNGWSGFVAADEMPSLIDPPEGFVAAANARVNSPGNGPLVSADNAAPYRIRRIRSVLAARDDHDQESMRLLQLDWWNGQAEMLLPTLLQALDAQRMKHPEAVADPLLDASVSMLRTWAKQPLNAPDAAAPLVFERWYLALAATVFAAALGPELWPKVLQRNYLLNDALDRLLLEDPASPWWRGQRDSLVRSSLERAIRDLARQYGDDPSRWRWDAQHRIVMRHELGKAVPFLGRWLDRGPYPWGGGPATVGRAGYRYDRPGVANHAATVRVIGEMRPTGLRMQSVMPGGQSGHPGSPHYDDQTHEWLSGRMDRLP